MSWHIVFEWVKQQYRATLRDVAHFGDKDCWKMVWLATALASAQQSHLLHDIYLWFLHKNI